MPFLAKKPSLTSISDPLTEPETEPDDLHQEAPSTSAMADHENEEEQTQKEEEEEEDPEEEPMEEEVEEEAEDVLETIKEKRKQKEFEVFVGGLPRDADENDLARVFNRIGEVVEVRLVKTHPLAPTNKGFAFVRFATLDQARKVIAEHRHVVVKGKSCGVIRNNDNETLHLANICTNWTKDDLIEKLKGFQLKNLEEVHLVDDPYNIGENKGFAFLEFSTHKDAVDACCKFQGRALFFGTDVKAEVSFFKIHEPDEEVMAQVKSLFLDGLPVSWDEAQLREQFKKFGEIESVQLARYMPTARRKDFGFICFTTREAAEYCIEQVNKAGVGEGDSKVFVKATWKRSYPQKRAPQKLGVRQGYISIGFRMKPQKLYGSAHSYLGRPARLQEWICRESNYRSRDFDQFPSSVPTFKTGVPPPAGKYRAQSRSKSANEMPEIVGSPEYPGYYACDEGRMRHHAARDTELIGATYDSYLRNGIPSLGEPVRPLAHRVDDVRLRNIEVMDSRTVRYEGGRPETPLPSDASNTLFVEGLPVDCTRREVSHIFRSFVGFKEVRLVKKDCRHPGGDLWIVCFVDFSTASQATVALDALQGYNFDEHDRESTNLRLQFSRFPGPRSARGASRH